MVILDGFVRGDPLICCKIHGLHCRKPKHQTSDRKSIGILNISLLEKHGGREREEDKRIMGDLWFDLLIDLPNEAL